MNQPGGLGESIISPTNRSVNEKKNLGQLIPSPLALESGCCTNKLSTVTSCKIKAKNISAI